MRNGVAQFLKMPRDRVRVVWMDGSQGYGRTAADDAGFEAAFLAKEIGRPVRVQWMRQEETAWDTKGPAYAFKMRGALDAQGNLVALHYDAHRRRSQSSRLQRTRHRARSRNSRACGKAEPARGRASTPSDMYVIPNRRQTTQCGGAAAGVGNAASDRQPARPRWSAGDVCVRVVHRRTRGGGKGGSGRVPSEAAHREHGGRQRLQTRALDRVHQGRGGEVRMGRASVTASRAAMETSSPVAASPTRIAVRRSWPRSPRSRSIARPGASG